MKQCCTKGFVWNEFVWNNFVWIVLFKTNGWLLPTQIAFENLILLIQFLVLIQAINSVADAHGKGNSNEIGTVYLTLSFAIVTFA